MITNIDFCVISRFQRHVHTYRILPDTDGLLAVQVRGHIVSFLTENHHDIKHCVKCVYNPNHSIQGIA